MRSERSGAAWVRDALADLGLRATVSEITDWLDAHGVYVSEDAIRSEIKRERARQARAAEGAGANVVSLTTRRA
ncbi:hypothetical protein [Planobispora rosea]|uniref:hypothetical protein n=1 Tax=Planobispora rosea TaxID=35762 RepID=UPI001941D845|nr:hypothetical protein [Planobispora rosea]